MEPAPTGGAAPGPAPPATEDLRLRRRRRRRAFAVVAALGPLVALELACRALYDRAVPPYIQDSYRRLLDRDLGPNYAAAYRPHPYTCYEPAPGFSDGTGTWSTEDAFRPPALPREKPAGALRVACCGGSTTFEPFVAVDHTYVAYLEEYLCRRFPGRRIEVLNAGVGGHNSADTFARFHYKVLDYAPDVVVNYDGINDVWPMLCPGPFENDLRHARKVMEPFTPPGPLVTRLARLSFAVRAVHFRVGLGGNVPSVMDLTYRPFDLSPTVEQTYARASTSAFRRNLEDTAFICKGRGIDLVLCSFAADPFQTGRDPAKDPYAILLRGVDDLNVVARDVARAQGLALADVDRLLPRNDPAAPPPHRTFADVCHTTTRGNRLRANIVGAALVPIVERRLGVTAVPFEHDTAPTADGSYPGARLAR